MNSCVSAEDIEERIFRSKEQNRTELGPFNR